MAKDVESIDFCGSHEELMERLAGWNARRGKNSISVKAGGIPQGGSMANILKQNNRNRKNGGKFEQWVADALGWTRVPFSGAVKEWGKADVMDGFFAKDGKFAGECKTHKLKEGEDFKLVIRGKWIKQMLTGEVAGRRGIIFVRRLRNGLRIRPFVVLADDTFEWFQEYTQIIPLHVAENQAVAAPKSYDFKIEEADLPEADSFYATKQCVRGGVHGEFSFWYIFPFKMFADILTRYPIASQND